MSNRALCVLTCSLLASGCSAASGAPVATSESTSDGGGFPTPAPLLDAGKRMTAPDAGVTPQSDAAGPTADAATAPDTSSTSEAGSHGSDASMPDAPASTVTPLPPAYAVQGGSNWGVDAPDDADQAAWVASGETAGGSNGTRGFLEKGAGGTFNGVSFPAMLTGLADLPTITNASNGGGTRFGPVTVDGVTAILHNVRQGDALRYQGNRSGFVYDGYRISHGEDHWFAMAFKLGPEWIAANSGGHADRTGLLDTHQQQASIGNPSGLNWWGDLPGGVYSGKELWWYVERYDGSGPAYLYNEQATPGAWMRMILHYRSGSAAQGPVYDVWLANGAGAFRQLARCIDPYTGAAWTTTPPFGDPLTNTLPQYDYVKVEMYKWTTGAYGSIPSRSMWTSGLFAAPGVDLYANAVAALAPWAL